MVGWHERFWKYVEKRGQGECWEWQASTTRGGYGQLNVGGRMERAPRLSWKIHFGPILGGMCVLHHCDNPGCVNPAHLFLGTRADNAHDRDRKGRYHCEQVCGERTGAAKLTEANVREMRRRHAVGGVTYRLLGEDYGVSEVAARKAVIGATWKCVKTASTGGAQP